MLDSILDIMRTKLKGDKKVSALLAKGVDDIVMLELCAIHEILSYSDFSQIMAVLNTMDRVSEPKLDLTRNMRNVQADPQIMSKYIPQYKGGNQYNFSDHRGFEKAQKAVSESEAKRALRTLVDFMKGQITERGAEMTYEPLFTQLINHKDKFLL